MPAKPEKQTYDPGVRAPGEETPEQGRQQGQPGQQRQQQPGQGRGQQKEEDQFGRQQTEQRGRQQR